MVILVMIQARIEQQSLHCIVRINELRFPCAQAGEVVPHPRMRTQTLATQNKTINLSEVVFRTCM